MNLMMRFCKTAYRCHIMRICIVLIFVLVFSCSDRHTESYEYELTQTREDVLNKFKKIEGELNKFKNDSLLVNTDTLVYQLQKMSKEGFH